MKSYLPAIAFVLFSIPLLPQVAWSPVGAKFHYTYWYNDFMSIQTGIMEVEVAGDTVIQNKNCRIFQQNSGIIGWNWNCLGNQYLYEEDSRVYFFDAENQAFQLLYDFTKEAGDSWEVPLCEDLCYPFQNLTVRVDSISFTELNGTSLNTQHVSLLDGSGIPFGNDRVYEGIGSATQMFFVQENCTTADVGFLNLRCFNSPIDGLFNFFGEDCDVINDVTQGIENSFDFIISPNPASDFVRFQFPDVFRGKKFNCIIFSLEGRTKKMLGSFPSENDQLQYIGDLRPGNYLIQVRFEDGMNATKKLVVSR
ncbi:MAG: T9SS type A sorting domain-containing protein [Saprospiraceae bacterium]|nr:MAG: T9SS type A sorting domain-containing protein [Saprospiraceae bacterium]